jgi:hypothetical protein
MDTMIPADNARVLGEVATGEGGAERVYQPKLLFQSAFSHSRLVWLSHKLSLGHVGVACMFSHEYSLSLLSMPK